jgi:hypothetical protein
VRMNVDGTWSTSLMFVGFGVIIVESYVIRCLLD